MASVSKLELRPDAAPLRRDAAPESFLADPDAGDRADASDDGAATSPSSFADRDMCCASRCAFMHAQRLVCDVMDEEIPDDRFRQPGECRNAKTHVVHDLDRDAAGVSVKRQTTRMPFVHLRMWLKRISNFCRSMICSEVHEIGIPERTAGHHDNVTRLARAADT
jgi:hypothetical protein